MLVIPTVFAISGCEPVPDLSDVQASFMPEQAVEDLGPKTNALQTTAFGQRIRQAVQASPALAQARAGLDIAQANQRAAEGAFLPQVSFGLNARTERVDSDLADVSPYLRVSQLVYDGGAAAGDLTAAQARVFESLGSQLQSASATALMAVETYVRVLDHRKIVDLTRRNVEAHQLFERQASERMASGAGSSADTLTAQSRVADARTRYADAVARADRAEARFREVFNTDPGSLPAPVSAPALQRTENQIVLLSPQVRRAEAALAAAEAELAAARARRQPDLRLSAFANQDVNRDANVGLGFSVNYELDSTGQRRAAVSAAEAQVRSTRYAREMLVREIGRELGFIRSDQKAGAERLRAARVAVKANEDSVAAARAQFEIGRRSLIEILDAQRDYVNAQERLILAEQNFFLTNYAALSLTGDILDVLGIAMTPPQSGGLNR